jgi:hypothetical protein
MRRKIRRQAPAASKSMLPPRFKERHYKARFSPQAIFFSRVVSLALSSCCPARDISSGGSFDIDDPEC